MEPSPDLFPRGLIPFGNGSGTDELCWEDPWQCPDARTSQTVGNNHTPQTSPDPTDGVESAPGTV